jgi:putative ABC transport system permease protein
VQGVEAAARIGRYEAFSNLGGSRQNATFIGIDRVDFPRVAFWRQDFSPMSLGALMNGLASAPNGVLVSADLYVDHYLNIGDTIEVTVDTFGQRVDIDFKVVGVVNLFPTWYPTDEDQGPLFVGNLDYIFREAGGQFPYNVWLRTDPSVSYEEIAEGIGDRGLRLVYWRAPRLAIVGEQRRPQRQGLFGVLSVGFVAAGLLTVLGFMLYAFFSFRRRFIELGVLRAVGLSAKQMTLFLGWELVFLMVIGIGGGTGLGVWISNLFIPYLQVGSGPASQIPPFVVQISWLDVFRFYILFGVLFIGALGILIVLLLRMKIFQAIKLGETA